jgi:signal transduction histidine kinase/ActR/RegA family two-component response regulator
MERDSEGYIKLLINNEEWLMGRILNYAKRQNYTKYTSTLQEAWRLSVSGLTESLVLQAKTSDINPPELHPDDICTTDPLSAFGILEAQKHRKRGTTVSMFLGLMKYYRQSYLDLIDESELHAEKKKKYKLFTERCFDRIEMGFVNEWIEFPVEMKMEELQSANRDITNEKNKYLTVFESLSTPIILLNENNEVVNFNLAVSKLFTKIKISGALYYSGENSVNSFDTINENVKALIKYSGEQLCFEEYLETLNGRRFFQVTLKKMLDVSEKYKGTIILLDDLTGRKEAEEILEIAKTRAEEADKLKTAFLANMSHEIRTPMNAILGFTELMITSNPAKKERSEYLGHIRKSCGNLLNIIEDIIDIAKIESNQIKIKYRVCKPYEVINDLYAVFNETLKNYGMQGEVDLTINVNENIRDISIYTDGDRLKQVLSNLLNNAAKFTNKGFIEFGYKIHHNSNLFFFVRDSGPGIIEEMRDKIFERFTQVEGTNSTNHHGAGLGLAICKNLVNLLGGNIWVESVIGKGSDFYFQLPLREIPKDIKIEAPGIPVLEIQNNIDWNGKSVLIAEDDDTNFIYLREILKNTSVKVYRAKNGLEAINIAESEEKLDLILMDIKMPEVDGIEAAKYISIIRPEIPIIAQTAFAMDGDSAKCIRAGCAAYLTKPIDKQKLFILMEKFLIDKARVKQVSSIIK